MKKGLWILASLWGAFYLASCQRAADQVESSKSARAGVVITFDDHSVEEWSHARPLFQKYGARATFFVDSFHTLNEAQVRLLSELQQDGHEIGVHSVDHVNARVYKAQYPDRTAEDYMKEQVLPAVEAMKMSGLVPASFSYPGGSGPEDYDAVLLRYFRMVRTNYKWEATYPFDGRRVVGAIGIDHQFEADKILAALEKARREGNALILFGHKIGAEPGHYWTTLDNLEIVLKYVHDHGMRFYRMGDLYSETPPRS